MGCRPLGQQPAPFGLRECHESNSLPGLMYPRDGSLNCKDPYLCCLLPAYGANSPGITKQAEDGASAAVGERGVVYV